MASRISRTASVFMRSISPSVYQSPPASSSPEDGGDGDDGDGDGDGDGDDDDDGGAAEDDNASPPTSFPTRSWGDGRGQIPGGEAVNRTDFFFLLLLLCFAAAAAAAVPVPVPAAVGPPNTRRM